MESLNEHRFPEAEILNHLEVRKSKEGILEVRGDSLLSGVAVIEKAQLKFQAHVEGEWYSSGDIGEVQEGHIKVRGRKFEIVKVLGELVNLPKLRSLLGLISGGTDVALVTLPSERAGHSIAMVFSLQALKTGYWPVLEEFNERVAPYERATQIYFIEEIPKTPLGKIKWGELRERLGG